MLEVALSAPLWETRIVTDRVDDPGEGGLVLVVERFGLSGNNITYAQLGNDFGLGYWRPFPAESGWGRVPAWGAARVVAGDPELADVGDRFVGFVPMADQMVLHAARTSAGLGDTSPERKGMLPLYRDMRRVSTDLTWREDLLDVNLVRRPAYPPAALLDDELGQDGTGAVMLTSATSKTALMTARLLTERGMTTIGLTSARHLDAAASTGAYTSVHSYDDVAVLPVEPTVLLDVAGDPATTRALHHRWALTCAGTSSSGARTTTKAQSGTTCPGWCPSRSSTTPEVVSWSWSASAVGLRCCAWRMLRATPSCPGPQAGCPSTPLPGPMTSRGSGTGSYAGPGEAPPCPGPPPASDTAVPERPSRPRGAGGQTWQRVRLGSGCVSARLQWAHWRSGQKTGRSGRDTTSPS